MKLKADTTYTPNKTQYLRVALNWTKIKERMYFRRLNGDKDVQWFDCVYPKWRRIIWE